MEPDKRYLSVGVFVLVTIAAAVLFALWLTGASDERDFRPYHIKFAESVSGLSVGSPVKFRGVEVGKVTAITIDQQDPSLIRVDVKIADGTPVKIDTVASLKLQGITGACFVELSGGSRDAPRLAPQEIGGIPEIPSETSGISAIVNRMPELIAKATQIADQINKLISDSNVSALSGLLEHSQHIAAALDQQTQQFAAVIDQASAIARDVHEITQDAKGDIHDTAEALKQSSRELNQLIARTNRVAGGDYEEFYSLLTEIKRTTRDLSGFARNLQENPSRLIAPPEQKGVPAP